MSSEVALRVGNAPDAVTSPCDPQSTQPADPGRGALRQGGNVEARQLVGPWNTSSSYDLHASDRAWWTAAVSLSECRAPWR